jgi:hypothetical protein
VNFKLLLFSVACFTTIIFKVSAQSVSLTDFEETEIPAPYTTAWYPLNSAKNNFKVSLINGKLSVAKIRRVDQTEYDLKDGKLFPIDNGEFGGALYYRPTDTTIKQIYVNGQLQAKIVPSGKWLPGLLMEYKEAKHKALNGAIYLARGNFQQVFGYNGGDYIASGTTHMRLFSGNFSKITKDENGFTITSVLDLEDCPMAFDFYKNSMYLATYSTFRVIKNWKDRTIKQDLFWETLNPNSVAVKDPKTIYIGFRGGYVRLNSNTGEIKFYKYKF